MSANPTAGRAEYLGVFLVALATLMLEILVTRIFSVTLWYHLAFVAVSIAMFGMTAGAVCVYLFSAWFTPARARVNFAASSIAFGLTAVWSIDAHLRLAFDPAGVTSPLTQLSVAYGLIAVPFAFSGIAISIALTQFPLQTGRLYAADLAGAALGCVLVMFAVDALGGPRAVVVASTAAGLGAMAFLAGAVEWRGLRLAAVFGLLVLAFATTFRTALPRSVLQLGYLKGERGVKPLYEKWNSYSRVAIATPRREAPFGWGLSETFQQTAAVQQLRLNIDASAETVLTAFDGDLRAVEHLKYDVTNIGHYVGERGAVFVVGAGGGRDVLSALAFGQTRIVAVEMNAAIIDAVNRVFGDLTGHLDRNPKVQFVNDEARSYLARSAERFDVIQLSLIDTWAATSAGAFVLSENTLYTIEAWRMFLDKLTPTGIVSTSRWFSRPVPGEMYKVAALATKALAGSGIARPREHLVVIATPPPPENRDLPSVATLLMKKTPFDRREVEALEAVAARMRFEVVLTPWAAADEGFVQASDAAEVDRFVAEFARADLSPPTDDRPFFFKMDDRLLNGLLRAVLLLTLTFIVAPVLLKAEPRVLRESAALSTGFAAIGLGFMLIEIAAMQRLILLLGHPTFSLSVVLFGLLVSSGLGSFVVGRSSTTTLERLTRVRFLTLVGVLVAAGAAMPAAIDIFDGFSTPVRVAVSLALLMPAGFMMGMAFPLAMRIGLLGRPAIAPWLWGINGAASVTASVLAVLISSTWGISAAWWTGVACYLVAAVAIGAAARAAERLQAPAVPPAAERVAIST